MIDEMNNTYDFEILSRIQDGEIDQFRFLVKKYFTWAFSFTKHKIKNPLDAEDIVQESFIKVYKNINKIKKETGFAKYFFATVRNTIIDYYRRQHQTISLDETIEVPDLNTQNDADLRELITQINPKYQSVLKLFEEGYSYEEIANKTRLNLNTVRTHIKRGREELKKLYERN